LKNHIRTTIIALAACLTAVSAGGCLVNRVVEVRGQVCAFEDHFDIDLADSATITFREPVLLASDVQWLAGASPTHTYSSGSGVTLVFEIEKLGAMPGSDPEFWLAADFRDVDGEQLLERLRIDPALVALLGPELPDQDVLAAAAGEACHGMPGLLSRSFSLSITEEDLALLPSRAELFAWLGEPLVSDVETGRVEYAYRLKNLDAVPPTARLSIWYDISGTRPLRMESEYSRFFGEADFESLTLTMNIEL
jgi:hypothetical protein